MRDENTPLCRAHIINKAFPASAPDCTVQRRDVDSFYGSNFEGDFVDIHKFKDLTPAKILADKGIAKRFAAKIYHEDQPVDFLYSSQQIPDQFARVKIDGVELDVPFALKMHP